jgi:hypothetical protein
VLGHDPQITYLNEPRTDICSKQAREHRGKLFLSAEDVISENAARFADLFAYEVYRQGTQRLVEKLPINSFRTAFIRILRNGLEVARSIERETQKYAWYAVDDYKWQLLATYAEARGLGQLVEIAEHDMFLRGLLEWELSVFTAMETLPQHGAMAIRYEKFLTTPVEIIRELETFIGVEPNPKTHQIAQETIQNTSPSIPFTPEIEQIAGELLIQLGYGA